MSTRRVPYGAFLSRFPNGLPRNGDRQSVEYGAFAVPVRQTDVLMIGWSARQGWLRFPWYRATREGLRTTADRQISREARSHPEALG